MDEAVAKHVQGHYGLLIGEETAEQAKLDAGSAWELQEELECTVGGRDLQSGMLRRRAAVATPMGKKSRAERKSRLGIQCWRFRA